jgi:hypothetical protein
MACKAGTPAPRGGRELRPTATAPARATRSCLQGPENWIVVQTCLLAEAGVPIMEIVEMEIVETEIAAERAYEFCFFGACIKLRGATGAPMRPVALPLRD